MIPKSERAIWNPQNQQTRDLSVSGGQPRMCLHAPLGRPHITPKGHDHTQLVLLQGVRVTVKAGHQAAEIVIDRPLTQ